MAEQTTSKMDYRTLSTPVETGIHKHLQAVTDTIVRLGNVEVWEVKTTKDINGQYYTVLATQSNNTKEKD